MPIVENEVIINAPVQEIYDYVSKPNNLLQIWPSLLEVTHQTLLPNGGYSYRWKYKMSGIRLSGIGESIEVEPNVLLKTRNIGD
jgi:Polyketide cyclase / dehydrase and lipid transport.